MFFLPSFDGIPPRRSFLTSTFVWDKFLVTLVVLDVDAPEDPLYSVHTPWHPPHRRLLHTFHSVRGDGVPGNYRSDFSDSKETFRHPSVLSNSSIHTESFYGDSCLPLKRPLSKVHFSDSIQYPHWKLLQGLRFPELKLVVEIVKDWHICTV